MSISRAKGLIKSKFKLRRTVQVSPFGRNVTMQDSKKRVVGFNGTPATVALVIGRDCRLIVRHLGSR